VAVLEDPFPGGAREYNRGDLEARKGRGWGTESVAMYTSSFEQVKRPGGAVRGGGEDLKKRLDLGSREGLGRRRKAEVVYTGFLEQVWRPGGTVPAVQKRTMG
jgi:hypothetical protein